MQRSRSVMKMNAFDFYSFLQHRRRRNRAFVDFGKELAMRFTSDVSEVKVQAYFNRFTREHGHCEQPLGKGIVWKETLLIEGERGTNRGRVWAMSFPFVLSKGGQPFRHGIAAEIYEPTKHASHVLREKLCFALVTHSKDKSLIERAWGEHLQGETPWFKLFKESQIARIKHAKLLWG